MKKQRQAGAARQGFVIKKPGALAVVGVIELAPAKTKPQASAVALGAITKLAPPSIAVKLVGFAWKKRRRRIDAFGLIAATVPMSLFGRCSKLELTTRAKLKLRGTAQNMVGVVIGRILEKVPILTFVKQRIALLGPAPC